MVPDKPPYIDRINKPANNEFMNENENMDPEVMADLNAVLEHAYAGTPVEPELARRIRERSEAVQKTLREKYGELNIAVDLIRDIRDEE